MPTLKIVIDHERCAGMGVCVLAAPHVFDQSDEDGKVFVIENANTEDEADRVRQAVASCPTRALSIEERK